MWRTSNHYNNYSARKDSLRSWWKKRTQGSFPSRLKEVFYGTEWIDLVIGRKIPCPSREMLERSWVFAHHPLYTFLWPEEFWALYKAHPVNMRDMYYCREELEWAVNNGLSRGVVVWLLSLEFRWHPKLQDVVCGEQDRLLLLYTQICNYGDERFLINWSARDRVRNELIGAMSIQTSFTYDDQEFAGLLDQLFAENPL